MSGVTPKCVKGKSSCRYKIPSLKASTLDMPLCPLEPSGTLQVDAQNSILRLLRPLLTVPRSKFVPNLQAKKQICHVIKLGLQMASILWRSQGCWNCDKLDQNCMQLRHIFPYVSILPRGSSASEGGPSWIWTWAIAICSIVQLELARIIWNPFWKWQLWQLWQHSCIVVKGVHKTMQEQFSGRILKAIWARKCGSQSCNHCKILLAQPHNYLVLPQRVLPIFVETHHHLVHDTSFSCSAKNGVVLSESQNSVPQARQIRCKIAVGAATQL